MKIIATASVNMGKQRFNNEDNLCFNGECLSVAGREAPFFKTITSEGECFGFCVCDGMGGESKGEEASMLGAKGFAQWLGQFKAQDKPNWKKSIGEYYQTAGSAVRELTASLGATSGCTSANVVLYNGKAWVSNLGDSRVYLLRKGKIHRLTVDQTLAEMMVKSGKMTREAAESSRAKHQLTGFLGAPEGTDYSKPQLCKAVSLRKGDRFLLCSDGLTDMLSEAQLLETAQSGETSFCVRRLMDMTLAAGARDNCTIILVEVSEKK